MRVFFHQSRLRRGAARTALAALIANAVLPLLLALAFVPSATASPFPICSAHAALAGDDAPGRKRAPTPLGCPLCPAPLPLEIPTPPFVAPAGWAVAVMSARVAAERIVPASSKPSPVWPHAPPARI